MLRVNGCDGKTVITQGAGIDYSVAESYCCVMWRKGARALMTQESFAGLSFLPPGPRRQIGLCERPDDGGSKPSQ